MTIDVIFFGVRTGDRAGHYYRTPDGHIPSDRDLPLPRALVSPGPDGRWCWAVPRTREQLRDPAYRASEPQGEGYIHFLLGWTIVSWWDRSEDHRGGCCAVFFVRGYHRWADALRLARESFPREMARMESAYRVGLAGADLPEPCDDPVAAFRAAATREAERLRVLHPEVLTALRCVMGWATP